MPEKRKSLKFNYSTLELRNNEIHRIPRQNYENHENLISYCQNYENHEILIISRQNHENICFF